MFIDETDSYFLMHITLNDSDDSVHVQPPTTGSDETELVGFLEIDADQDAATGLTP